MGTRLSELITNLQEIADKHGGDQPVFTTIGEAVPILSAAYEPEEREDMNEEGDGLGDIIAPEGVYLEHGAD